MIEDSFVVDWLLWDLVGVIFVGDVEFYEDMKLCMFNGSYVFFVYFGVFGGKEMIVDCMVDFVFK